MTNEIKGGGQSQAFDYKQMDEQTAEFLKDCGREIDDILAETSIKIGGILFRAQERLAKNGYGCFGEWLEYKGYARRTAYEMIDTYKTFVRIPHNQRSTFESLPTTLQKTISSKSAESTPAKAQAKAEVLAGEIDTLKAYKERIDFLEKQAEAERSERERLEIENEQLAKQADKPPEIRTEYIEVDNTPHDYETTKQRLEEYRAKFGDLENYDEHITATHRQDMIVAVMSFSQGVREFIKRYDYMTKYKSVIDNLDEESKQQYDEAVEALKEMAGTFDFTLKGNIVFDAEYNEIN